MISIKSEIVKIRFIIGSLDIGGAETHLVRLLPFLAENGFQVSVLTLTQKGEMASQLEQVNIPVYEPSKFVRFFQRIPVLSRLTGSVATIYYLALRFNREPVDIICFYLPSSYYLGMISAKLAGNNNKTIMFRRSLNVYLQERYLIRKFEIWLHKHVTMIVGNSQAVIDQLCHEENVSPEKTRLIYNGITMPEFNVRNTHSSIRKELKLDEDTLVLTIVANLIPYKGHIDLIHALSLIKDTLKKPWMLLVAGAGIENRKDLLTLVSKYKLNEHVCWLGLRNDIAEIYSESDIGLLVSHQESFSNAILEGMASAIPMIVTNVGGNSEAVIHEKSGLVVEPHSPQQLASAILRLSENELLRREYGDYGRLRVQAKFTAISCLSGYIQLFKFIDSLEVK